MEQMFILFMASACAFVAGVYVGDRFHTVIDDKLAAAKAKEQEYAAKLKALEDAIKGKGP